MAGKKIRVIWNQLKSFSQNAEFKAVVDLLPMKQFGCLRGEIFDHHEPAPDWEASSG
jgi:hypothetical protein